MSRPLDEAVAALSEHRARAVPADRSPGLFDDPLPDPAAARMGKVGGDHPTSAVRAAVLSAPRAGSQRARVLDHLAAAPNGLTAAQLADRMGISRNQMGARLLELREDGWVAYAVDEHGGPVERPTDEHGNRGLVQVLTDAGRAQWNGTR